jgi:hypothetical protein
MLNLKGMSLQDPHLLNLFLFQSYLLLSNLVDASTKHKFHHIFMLFQNCGPFKSWCSFIT